MENKQIVEKLKDSIQEKYGINGRAGIVIYEAKNKTIQVSSMFSLDIDLLCFLVDTYRKYCKEE